MSLRSSTIAIAKFFGLVRNPDWRKAIKSELGARIGAVSIKTADHYVVWDEPNRAQTPTLHIGNSGERYSTLTGVWWLSSTTMIVSHRSGLRLAVFDTTSFAAPIWIGAVDHVADDVAAKPTGPGQWEIATSGCWDCIYSRYRLTAPGDGVDWNMESLGSKTSATRDFCHGVAYDQQGQLCWSIHTGKAPRFAIGDAEHRLPAPWGVRDLIHDAARQRYLAIAVSANPKKTAYDRVATTVWASDAGGTWTCLCALPGVHSDSLGVWGDRIWIPDQVSDRLLCLDANTGAVAGIFTGDCFSFPHGLGISDQGRIAVTNYGTSSLVILDPAKLMAE